MKRRNDSASISIQRRLHYSNRFLTFVQNVLFNPKSLFGPNTILFMKKTNELYEIPTITVLEIDFEGVVCQSGEMNNPNPFIPGGDPLNP